MAAIPTGAVMIQPSVLEDGIGVSANVLTNDETSMVMP